MGRLPIHSTHDDRLHTKRDFRLLRQAHARLEVGLANLPNTRPREETPGVFFVLVRHETL